MAIALAALAGCAVPDRPQSDAPPAALPSGITTHGAAANHDWRPGYVTLIAREIKTRPALLAVAPRRVGALCPRWSRLGPEQKASFYAALIRAIAWQESGHDPAVMAWEKTLGVDPVTRYPVVSEGLLQLSYQDQELYQSCRFDFAADRAKFAADWTLQHSTQRFENRLLRVWSARHLDRTILRPEAQFACAVGIMHQRLTEPKHRVKAMAEVLAGYWSVMNQQRSALTYRAIRRAVGESVGACRA